MTNKLQAIADRVLTRVLEQGRPAFTHNGCKYRLKQEDGTTLMCAAGGEIKDEFYSSSFEGQNVGDSVVREALEKSGFFDGMTPKERSDSFSLLLALQSAHDAAAIRAYDRDNFFTDPFVFKCAFADALQYEQRTLKVQSIDVDLEVSP